MDCNKEAIRTGLKTLSSNCPHAPATVTVVWFPNTCAITTWIALTSVDRHDVTATVIAHLGCNHGQRLDLGRVDLPWHDTAAGLVGRQLELAQTAARAAT